MLSWRLGLKANALYRDGSKLSQPLSLAAARRRGGGRGRGDPWPSAWPRRRPPSPRPDGRRADRREKGGRAGGREARGPRSPCRPAAKGYTQKAIVGGHKVFTCGPANTTTASWARSSSTCTRKARPSRSLMNNFAIAVSIGLQYGVAAGGVFVEAFHALPGFESGGMVFRATTRDQRWRPRILDYMFREAGDQLILGPATTSPMRGEEHRGPTPWAPASARRGWARGRRDMGRGAGSGSRRTGYLRGPAEPPGAGRRAGGRHA